MLNWVIFLISCLDFKWCSTDNIIHNLVMYLMHWIHCHKVKNWGLTALKLYTRYQWVCYSFITGCFCQQFVFWTICQQFVQVAANLNAHLASNPFIVVSDCRKFVVCYVLVWCTYLDSFSVQLKDLLMQSLITCTPPHIGAYLVHFWSPDMHWWSSINRVFCEVLILQELIIILMSLH